MPDKPALVKCLVWDLDNTLWQGTLLEDRDVRLPAEIRQVISTLDARGILQSVASKNDHDQAWERLEQLGVAEYFEDLSRVEELTLRTSQMNATGVHYPDAVLRGLLTDPDHEVLTVSLSDRFGPHGAVGVMLLAYHPAVWHLKLLATSCRVVSFGAGAVILNWLIDQASRAGVHLAADFRSTDRNRMMDIAYRFAGFTDEACPCTAGLGSAADGDGIQCLHLIAAPREAPTTMHVTTPDLSAARIPVESSPPH